MNLPELRGKVKIEFTDLEAAALKAKVLGDVLKKELGSGAVSRATRDTEVALTGLGAALASIPIFGGPAAKALGSLDAEMFKSVPLVGDLLSGIAEIPVVGGPAVAILIGLGVQMVALSSTFVVAGAGIVTVLGAVAAGFTAMAGAAAAALGPLALLGIGVVLLSQRTKAGQDAMAGLQKHVGQAADALAKQALPEARLIFGFLDQQIPVVQKLGSELLTWFGPRLPTILGQARQAVAPFVADLHQLGAVVGGFVDQVTARMPAIGPILQQGFAGGVAAVKGLADNLLRFVDWFQGEWPKLAPIASQIMSQVGQAIQGLGREAVKLVDFFVRNWPEISHAISDLMPVLDALGHSIEFVGSVFVGMMRETEFIVARLGDIANAFRWLGNAIRSLPPIPFLGVNQVGGGVAAFTSSGFGPSATGGRAAGGPVVPGGVYRVGEGGSPETLLMGRSGGYVIPDSGRSGGPVEVSNMTSNRRIERLLETQNALLAQIVPSGPPVIAFSNRAYGT